MNTFRVLGTTISFVNEDERNIDNWFKHKFKHYGIFYRMLNMLTNNGFVVSKDEEVNKCIMKDHYIGRKNELKFKASKYQNGFKIEFYQDVNFENKYGGYYDFDKFNKMPYTIQKQFQCTANKIVNLLSQFAENNTDPECYNAEDKIKHNYVINWNHPQNDMNFNLSDLDGTTCDDYNNKDRDKKTLYNGDIKYFRDSNGYLCRGKIYHNINNMWWIIINDIDVRNVGSFELFDLTETDERTRKVTPVLPKSYIEKKKILSQCTTSELKNELKRRLIS